MLKRMRIERDWMSVKKIEIEIIWERMKEIWKFDVKIKKFKYI